MKKSVIIAIIVATIAVPALAYAASPLFINTTINEPLPETAGGTKGQKTSRRQKKWQ